MQEFAERERVKGVSERDRCASSWEPTWMGMSVEAKVEMSYWLGSVGEIRCWVPSSSETEGLRVAGSGVGDDRLFGGGDFGICGMGEVGYEDVTPGGAPAAGRTS